MILKIKGVPFVIMPYYAGVRTIKWLEQQLRSCQLTQPWLYITAISLSCPAGSFIEGVSSEIL